MHIKHQRDLSKYRISACNYNKLMILTPHCISKFKLIDMTNLPPQSIDTILQITEYRQKPTDTSQRGNIPWADHRTSSIQRIRNLPQRITHMVKRFSRTLFSLGWDGERMAPKLLQLIFIICLLNYNKQEIDLCHQLSTRSLKSEESLLMYNRQEPQSQSLGLLKPLTTPLKSHFNATAIDGWPSVSQPRLGSSA